MAPKDPQTK